MKKKDEKEQKEPQVGAVEEKRVEIASVEGSNEPAGESVDGEPVGGEGDAGAPAEPGEDSCDRVDSVEPGGVVDIAALVAEAEYRGYLRGRNESVGADVNGGVWEQARSREEEQEEGYPVILAHVRRSVWEGF